MKALYEKLYDRLEWRHWWKVAILVFCLYIPTLFTGRVMDDFVFEQKLSGTGGEYSHLIDLFNFNTALAGDEKQLRYLPWWTAEGFKVRFFRPLTALLVILDVQYLSPAWRHLHSLLWYGLLLAGLAGFYREALADPETPRTGEKIAFLAWVMFALNDAHALPVAWLAHRSSVIALCLGVWSLWAFERYMRGKGPAFIGPFLFLLSLTAGEAALSLLGYVFFRSIRKPLRLLPYGGIVMLYLFFYRLYGFGTAGSASYVNPIEAPGEFFLAALERWPVLVGSALGPVSANLWMFLEGLPAARYAMVGLGVLAFVFALRYFMPFRDFTGFWMFMGASVSLIPACAAMAPSDRLLMVAGVGFFPIIARFLLRPGNLPLRGGVAFVHLFLAAVLLPVFLYVFYAGSFSAKTEIQALVRQVPAKPRQMVLINGPGMSRGLEFFPQYEFFAGDESPETMMLLTSNLAPVRLHRVGGKTLEMEATFLSTLFEQAFRDGKQGFRVGQVFHGADAEMKILSLNGAGTPRKIRFEFKLPLEEILFVTWWKSYYKIIQPPAPGRYMEIPAPDPAQFGIYL